jgi:glycosyltransferase involved in cell wall biosynthesis
MGDINGNFVYELATRLKNDFEIFVLAPAYKDSLHFEINDEIKIYRHKQFLIKNVELAYGIGIYENLKRNKFKYFMLPFYFFFQFLLIKKLTQKEKITIIHAHWLIPNGFIAVLCKKILKIDFKIISTIHGSDFWGYNNKLGNSLKKFTLNNIDTLTVVSNALKEKVIEFGYKNEVFVYPMGLDTTLFSPSKRDESLKERLQILGPFLLFVGTIIEQKGIRHLIQALPTVLKKIRDAKLVVIGDGNLKKGMGELTKKLKIEENVIFTGSIPHNELPPYFATADLFILPSFSEGLGLVIIEALSCKTLAITSNLEVIHDIICDNETGFFFEEINKDAISEKIITILRNKGKFENIREKGRQYVIEKFDWNIVKSNYCNLFKNII